jgi:hypothetical protein
VKVIPLVIPEDASREAFRALLAAHIKKRRFGSAYRKRARTLRYNGKGRRKTLRKTERDAKILPAREASSASAEAERNRKDAA